MYSGIETLLIVFAIFVGSMIRLTGEKKGKNKYLAILYEILIIAGIYIVTVNFICRLDIRFESFQKCSTIGFILGYVGVRVFDKIKNKFFK